MSVQVYSFLGQTEGERMAFLEGWKKGDYNFRLPPRALGCHKRCKILSFCEVWSNPTLPLFFIRLPYKQALQTWSFIIILWLDSLNSQKQRILLSARQRPRNYLGPSRGYVLGEHNAVTLKMLYLIVLKRKRTQHLAWFYIIIFFQII